MTGKALASNQRANFCGGSTEFFNRIGGNRTFAALSAIVNWAQREAAFALSITL